MHKLIALVLLLPGMLLAQVTNTVTGPISSPVGGALSGSLPNPNIANTVTGYPTGGAGGVLGSIKYIAADLYSTAGCTTVSGGVTSTQLDCAFYTARDTAAGSGNSVMLMLGTGFYSTCQFLTEPTAGFYDVNLWGSGMFNSFILYGCPTWSSATAYITGKRVTEAGVIYVATAPNTNVDPASNPGTWSVVTVTPSPALSKLGGNAYFKMQDLSFNMTSSPNITSCFDIEYLNSFELRNINCLGVPAGVDHMIQIGSNAGFAVGGLIENVWTSPPYNISQTYATITPTFTGTSLTGLSCGGSCGTYHNNTFAIGQVNDPHKFCSTLPAFTPTFTGAGTAITGFTITNAGNCSSPPDIMVIQQQNIAVGMQLYVSDSVITGVQLNNGIIGAELYGGNDKLIGIHPTAIQTGMVINNTGNADIVGYEPDTVSGSELQFVTNQATTVEGLVRYSAGGPHLPGQTSFEFTSTSNNVHVLGVGALCPTTCPTDYQEFIGPSGVLTPGGSGWPAGATVIGNDPVSGNGNYTAAMGIGALTVTSCTGCTGGLANTTTAVTGATQNANTCSSPTTQTVTGLTTSMVVLPGYSSDPSALTGWGTTGGMVFHAWPSATNTMNWNVCNPTGSNITYSSITFNDGFK